MRIPVSKQGFFVKKGRKMTVDSSPKFIISDTIVELRKMHAASWRDTYPSPDNGVSKEWVEARTANWITPEGIKKSETHFRNIIGNPDHLHKIARCNDEVVGFLHVFRKEAGGYRLGALYAATPYHGTGLAQRLMHIAIDWCDAAQPIDLEVATYNDRAKAFYAKYEFLEKPGTEHLYAETMPVITMERKGAEK